MHRTAFLLAGVGLALSTGARSTPSPAQSIADIESRYGGRLGVAIFDSGSGLRVEHRAGERFALCSTFKWLAAAAVLARVDAGAERLDRRVKYSRSDLLDYSPITSAQVAHGSMTLSALCAAAIEFSDNTAANLVLASIGGPNALTEYARSLGDPVTRLDRMEPGLNEAAPGDVRDTTSPAAMVSLMDRILLGSALSARSRAMLVAWLDASTTGDKRLRAGIPAGWSIGDKTGTCGHAATNDVAIARPPGRPPLLVAVYYAESPASDDERDVAIAEVGRVAARLCACPTG
jgi:beta-lactamase class A